MSLLLLSNLLRSCSCWCPRNSCCFCLPAITGVSAVPGVPAIAHFSNIPGSTDIAKSLLLPVFLLPLDSLYCEKPCFSDIPTVAGIPPAVADNVAGVPVLAGTPAEDCVSADDGCPDVVWNI